MMQMLADFSLILLLLLCDVLLIGCIIFIGILCFFYIKKLIKESKERENK